MRLTNLTIASNEIHKWIGHGAKWFYHDTMIAYRKGVIHFTLTRLVLLLYVRSALLIFNRRVAIFQIYSMKLMILGSQWRESCEGSADEMSLYIEP